MISILLLWGCSSTHYVAPLDMPQEPIEQAIEEAREDLPFQGCGEIRQEWWLLFNDSQLTEFIHKTFARNPTLQSAQAKIWAAIYRADSARASLHPYMSLGADVSRQKLSKTGVIPFASGPSGSGTPTISVPRASSGSGVVPEFFTLYETELNLKYTFDFWNKNRNTLRAALGEMQANIAEEAFVQLELGIAVASVYYELQIKYKQEEIAKLFIENRARYSELIHKRLQANLDNELSLQSADANLVDARGWLLQIQGDIALLEYQLMALMGGSFDEEIQSTHLSRQPLPQTYLPQDLPLHLVSKRPDIIAQLWLIESAGRQIEVAKAGFYPDFNLTAFFGFQTIHFADLFKWPSRYFNVDPAVSLPIFDGGRLVADLHTSEINYEVAILDYNQLVINAAKEVLDAIATLRNTWQRLQEFEHKLTFQKRLHQLTALRVTHNLSNSLDELIRDGNVLTSQEDEMVAQGKVIQAILALIKAVGGGYP